MSNTPAKRANRREWLRTAVRAVVLGGLGGGAALLLARRGRTGAGVCPYTPSCSDCPALAGCSLPERRHATQAKR